MVTKLRNHLVTKLASSADEGAAGRSSLFLTESANAVSGLLEVVYSARRVVLLHAVALDLLAHDCVLAGGALLLLLHQRRPVVHLGPRIHRALLSNDACDCAIERHAG